MKNYFVIILSDKLDQNIEYISGNADLFRKSILAGTPNLTKYSCGDNSGGRNEKEMMALNWPDRPQ